MFSIQEYSIHRGHVGLAKKGNIDYLINYIELKDTPIVNNVEKLDVNFIMSNIMFDTRSINNHCAQR